MKTTIPSNATAASVKSEHPVPRGATHFRFTEGKRKPVIDKIENLDTLAGCSGKLEYGKVTFDGRGRHAKVKEFTPVAVVAPAATAPSKKEPAWLPTREEIEKESPAPAAPTASRPKGTKLNRILGFSACAVAKALGKAGAKHEEADRIFRAHGITMPKASISVQLGFGRNPAKWERHGQPADLTDAQIAELRSGATA